jgi:hypothetical protein
MKVSPSSASQERVIVTVMLSVIAFGLKPPAIKHPDKWHNFWNWIIARLESVLTAPGLTAIGTLILAVVTYRVMITTRAEGERNHFFNMHQLNLRYRADFYEEVLMLSDDSLSNLEATALSAGLTFSPEATPRTVVKSQPPLDARRISIQLKLHASPEIRSLVQTWIETWILETERLKDSPGGFDAFGDPAPQLQEPELSRRQAEFKISHDFLADGLQKMLKAMAEELHPAKFTVVGK